MSILSRLSLGDNDAFDEDAFVWLQYADPLATFIEYKRKWNIKNPLAVQFLTYYWNYIWQLDILVTDLIVLLATIRSN